MGFFTYDRNSYYDYLKGTKRDENQKNQYKPLLEDTNIEQNLTDLVETFPEIPADMAVPMAMQDINVDYEANKEIAQEVVNTRIYDEVKLWNELQDTFSYESVENNMKMTVWDLVFGGLAPGGAKPGDVQYGVWLMAGLDALFQTFGPSGKWSVIGSAVNALAPGQPMKVGRSQAYLRDIREYDKLLKQGYSEQKAQNLLQIDLSNTNVKGLGEELGGIDNIKKYIDMVGEAHKMGGEPVLAAMWRNVVQGKPLNFDRATKFTLEAVKAENTPYYIELTTKYNMSPEEASAFIYKNIGEPIKNFDENGEIHYLSKQNPNKINFYAGRARQRYFWAGQTKQDYYRPEWANKNILMEYSPGKITAAEVYEPGTKAFHVMSGLVDASYQLLPELFAAKGVKGFKNLGRGLRGVNPALESVELGRIKQTGKSIKISPRAQADEILKSVGDEIDGVTGTGNMSKYVDEDGRFIKGKEYKKDYRQTKKFLKKQKREATLFGRVPKFYQETADEILNKPENINFFKAIADEDNVFLIDTNSITRDLPMQIRDELAETTDWKQVQSIFGDMISSSGYAIKNEIGQVIPYTLPGRMLPKTGSLTLNKILRQTGINPNAAYRTFGSFAGENLRRVRQTIFPVRKGKRSPKRLVRVDELTEPIIDKMDSVARMRQLKYSYKEAGMPDMELPEFERYLGFSSNFNSSYNPWFRKTLGVVPDLGVPLHNIEVGRRQLSSHLQILGYDALEANKILKEFSKIDGMDKRAIRQFTSEQSLRDLAFVKARGGNWEYVEKAVSEIFEGQKKMKIYGTATGSKTLPSTADGFNAYDIISDGNAVFADGKHMQAMTASLFSEMVDNVAPLLDYRLVDRAMRKMFRPYKELSPGVFKEESFLYDTKQFIKYLKPWGDDVPNPFDKGVFPVKRLEENFITNLTSFYTRNVFKPLVLMRFAFFTRVFLEEQARIAVKGLSGLYNKPHEYLAWVFAHNPNSKAGAALEKISLGTWSRAKQNDDAVEFLMQEEVIEAMQKSFRPTDYFEPRSRQKQKYTEYKAFNKSELTIEEITESIYAELRHLRNDPLSQKVAEYGYNSPKLNEWLVSPAGREARLQLVRYGGNKFSEILRDGSKTLDQHIQYLESRIRISSGGKVVEGKDIFKQADGSYVYALRANVNTGSGDIRHAIAHGKLTKYGGSPTNKKDVLEFYSNEANLLKSFKKKPIIDELAKYYNKTDGLDPGMMTVPKYFGPDAGKQNFLGQLQDGVDVFYQVVFDHLMTKPIGILNRSTTFKQFRWMYIGERFQDFSVGLRKQFIQEAKDAKIPKRIIDELEGAANFYKPGKIKDYEAMNIESKAYGLAGVKELLYDTRKRHTISDKLVNVFPFVEVWFEVAQTWGKLLAESPYVLRGAQVSVRGGSSANALGSSSNDGFITPSPMDPNEDMFVMPFGGYMSNMIFDAEDGESNVKISPRGYLQGVNLLGQGFVPGPNPMVGFALSRVLPRIETASTKMGAKYGWANDLEKRIFGDFPPPQEIQDVFAISPVYKKLGAWLKSDDSFDVINDSSSEIERMRAKATIDLWRWGVSSGEPARLYKEGKLDSYLQKLNPGMSLNEVNQGHIEDAYLEWAKVKSGDLFFYQFLFQFFGPTGMQPEYFIDDKQGNLWGQAVLYEEYLRIREKNDGNDTATYNEFFQLYGVEHPYMMSPRSQSEIGKQSYSERVQQFQKANPEIFDSLKVSGYYLNIDNPYEEKNYSDIVREKNLLSPDQYRRNVNDTIGFFRYKTFTKNLDKIDMPSLQKTLLKRMYREDLKLELPGFQADEYGLLSPPSTQTIFNEMRTKWIQNPAVMELEAGKGFAEALKYWEEAEAISVSLSPSRSKDWWLTSDSAKAKGIRIWMYNKANLVIEKYPEFWPAWNGVMLKLYRDDQEYLDYLPEG